MGIIYGKKDQINFSHEKERYEAIGFLCNSKNCSTYIEHNQKTGSYTNAYRITLKVDNAPKALKEAIRSDNRINCNKFIEELIQIFGFVNIDGKHIEGDYQDVLERIPKEYKESFDRGYRL